MEMGLDLGIRNGLSADQISRDLRQYLQHPDMLFRRVRDEHGILHLSKRAAAFHPGQGVYRSSYLNARRLAVTETNAAYRTADHERWQNLDFVVGIEIHLSGNHTCKGRDGKQHAFTDICDELAGKYPKDFKFTGWHPHCRCYATTILKTEEEMAADDEKILRGEPVSGESVNEVKDVPEGFKEWMERNQERMERAETLPSFIKDNVGLINGVHQSSLSKYFETISKTLTPTEPKDLTHINDCINEIYKQHPEYFKRGFSGIKAVSNKKHYMSTTLEGEISVNFATDENGFNAGESLLSAFEKLEKRKALNQHEEYAIEALWHEILHNKSNNTVVLPPIKTVNVGFTRCVAETINQLVARHTYKGFIRELGGKGKHQKWIMENGYGYGVTVSNLRLILQRAGLDEKKFVAEANNILMEDYTNINQKIGDLLVEMNDMKKKKKLDNIRAIFNSIEMSEEALQELITKNLPSA